MSLLLLSFVAGFITVLAPCILPLLPVILGGALRGGDGHSYMRAFRVVIALACSLILFTFVLKVSTAFIYVPEQFWKYLSGGIVTIFGVTLLFPVLWARIPGLGAVNQKSSALLGAGMGKKNIVGDIVVGMSLGPVFATCSPTYFVVLATVLPVSFALGFTYIAAYALGLSFALLLIILAGERMLRMFGVAANPSGMFKKILGAMFVIVGIAVMFGYDKKLERALVDAELFDVTRIEIALLKRLTSEPANAPTQMEVPAVMISHTEPMREEILSPQAVGGNVVPPKDLTPLKPPLVPISKPPIQKQVLKSKLPPALEIVGASGYINTNDLPITIGEYKGESVVLIEFWTYSCINCQRALPHTISWHERYKDRGLVVIGIHTPEFGFEKLKQNVIDATLRFGVTYPVVMDNEFRTWNAFGNRYWPRKYLIDMNGNIIHDQIGEGGYAIMETKIQGALLQLVLSKKAGA